MKTTDLQNRIQHAYATGGRLLIRGGGSKNFLQPPLPDAELPAAEVLDTKALRGIIAYEPSELVLTAWAGTPLVEIEAALAEKNQYLAFEPPHFTAHATLGGAVASGMSGPARAAVGALRDYVLGVQMINGKGELLTFGGQVIKNVAGYDVSRLLAGSWGRLGLMTQNSIKVVARPVAEATLLFELDENAALNQLHAWRAQALPLNASSWIADAGAGVKNCLYLRLRGAAAAVAAACAELGGERQNQVADDWLAQRELSLPFYQAAPSANHGLWRLSVAATTPALALPAGCSGPLTEWFGAQRWVWAESQHADALFSLAAQAGGHASLFRLPQAEPDYLGARTQKLDATNAQINQNLKTAFDPKGVFAGGR